MINILSIDLEDYYQVSAFESVVKREDWDKYESRIECNTYRLLEILNGSIRNPHSALRTPVQGTFFCLGWIADRHPNLIKEIHRQGHEIACHSYDHQLVYNLSPGQFRIDIQRSKKILQDLIGEEVIGYRAPSYSITKRCLWGFDILAEEGYSYDSSIFPIHHDRYGIPNAPRFPFIISMNGNNNFEFEFLNLLSAVTPRSALRTPHCLSPNSELRTPNSLLEFPISTVRLFGQNLPISGGGYFRLLPYCMVRKGLKRINDKERQPFIFYLHPWELDPDQPRMNGISRRSRFRHYLNLEKTETRIEKLLGDFNFSSLRGAIESKISIE